MKITPQDKLYLFWDLALTRVIQILTQVSNKWSLNFHMILWPSFIIIRKTVLFICFTKWKLPSFQIQVPNLLPGKLGTWSEQDFWSSDSRLCMIDVLTQNSALSCFMGAPFPSFISTATFFYSVKSGLFIPPITQGTFYWPFMTSFMKRQAYITTTIMEKQVYTSHASHSNEAVSCHSIQSLLSSHQLIKKLARFLKAR